MARYFNTAGPCRADMHYMLPPEERIAGVRPLIEQQQYFVLHAPRQVGKTTAFTDLAQALTREGKYAAVMFSVETGAAFPHDVASAEQAILRSWETAARALLPEELHPPNWENLSAGGAIGRALSSWAESCPRPLVVFLDEIDSLQDATLVSILRQLRDGHRLRPGRFPCSIALVGLRDVRDYKIAGGDSDRLRTSLPFNVKVDSLTMPNFTLDQMTRLFAQHTVDTGQVFELAAIAQAFYLTRGQPWLVNALARQLVEALVVDRAQPIRADAVDRARDILIERQDTHLDSLGERLREPRVRAIIAPMIQGESLANIPDDDLRFVLDLGLVQRETDGTLEIANPIYREIIAKILTNVIRATFPKMQPRWLTPGGTMDWLKLRAMFVEFWLEHGEVLMNAAPYSEAAAQLVMMAFLSRVANGGGRVDREYAIGSKRLDLCLHFGDQQMAVEVKTWRDSDKAKDPMISGVEQLDGYLARLGALSGWLVVFDQRTGRLDLDERVSVTETQSKAGREITVIRL